MRSSSVPVCGEMVLLLLLTCCNKFERAYSKSDLSAEWISAALIELRYTYWTAWP